MEAKCPAHGFELVPQTTEHGIRRHCPSVGCTVVCWDGSTSTPADEPTRALRMQCHRIFDQLWRSGRMSRNTAYRWLAKELGVHRDDCHFGYMDAAACLRALEVLNARGDVSPPSGASRDAKTVATNAVRSFLGKRVRPPNSGT